MNTDAQDAGIIKKHNGSFYRIHKRFTITDKKTGTRMAFCPGEPVPDAVLKNDEARERLLREGKLALSTPDGHVMEDAHQTHLTHADINRMLDRPEQIAEHLQKTRFTENSLLDLRRLATIRGLDKDIIAAIDRAIER